ncbi:MAG: heparinase II/III-family protein [Lachnospiraceae bacterium]|nr:heparinase II/III-family protein [Lachnospiraceae bacterium]
MTENDRMTIQELLEQGYRLLRETEGYTTRASRYALRKEMEKAERVLSGEFQAPFSHNREFLSPEESDPAKLCIGHYTRAPGWLPDEADFDIYGLREAIGWFRHQDIREDAASGFSNQLKQLNLRIEEFLELDSEQYSEAEGQAILHAWECAGKSHGIRKGKAIIKTYDLLREMIHSKPLTSETDDDCIGLFRVSEILRNFRDFLKASENRQIADRIREEGNRFTMAQLQQEWRYRYDIFPSECPWNESGNGLNFAVPEGCEYGALRLLLPGGGNDLTGEDRVCLTGFHLVSAQGKNIRLPNGDFTEGMTGWRPDQVCKGAGCQWKMEGGKACVCLYASSPGASAGVVSQPFQMESGRYTLCFDFQIGKRLCPGLLVELLFYDSEHRFLGSCRNWFQKKSWPRNVRQYNLSMQCNAILYLMTGEKEYAGIAKLEMLCFLNDFCQGAEYWMVRNERPEGLDCYGAVQGGRNLCSVAFTCGLIRRADVFSEEEKRIFFEMIDFLLSYMMDSRDRCMLTGFQAQKNSGNWQTDMCMGVACIMSVLTEFPDRRLWFHSAVHVLRGQLRYTLNPDGSWPESLRYHFAALERFSLLGLLLKNETGEDLFSQPELQRMFLYPMEVQTPGYAFFKGQIGTPPFGDHTLQENAFALYGAYIQTMYSHSPLLASRMYDVWQRSGRGRLPLWGESVIGQLFLYPSGDGNPGAFVPPLESTARFPDSGIYVFRGGSWSDRVNYLAVMSSQKPIRHGHHDQGSFILYHQNVPLIMDTGIEGYFDVSTQWHLCSMSHACLQFPLREKQEASGQLSGINLSAGNFSAAHGLADVPLTSRVSKIRTEGSCQGMSVIIQQSGGEGVHTRQFLFYPESGVCIVKDSVKNFGGIVTVTYPLAARDVQVDGPYVFCEGYYGQVFTLEIRGNVSSIAVEKGRAAGFFPTEDEIPCMVFLRLQADAGSPLTVTVSPGNTDQGRNEGKIF